jgi:predicted RNase H-like nuclease
MRFWHPATVASVVLAQLVAAHDPAARRSLDHRTLCRIVGSLGEGYIVTPVRPQDAACLDAEAASRS